MKIGSFWNKLQDPAPGDGSQGGGGGAPAPAPSPSPAPAPAGGSPAPAPAPSPAPAPAPPAESFWKDDWRQQYAGADGKRLKELERYASPKAALDGLFAAKQRIQEGSIIPALKPGATPDEVKAYRDSLGVPEKPDGYEIKLSGDRKIDEEDKPMVGKILERLHAVHARPDVVNATLEAFHDIEDTMLAEQGESDRAARTEVEETLRTEWGGDYRRNVAMINGLLDGAPTGVKDAITSARDANGITMLNNVAVMRWLADMTRAVNPVATVVPGSNNPAQAIGDEITSLKALMGNHNSEYWKGPKAAQLQARYRELLTAKEKMAA